MASCSAGHRFEDSVMTVHYLPITSATVTAAEVVNNDVASPQITTDFGVSPGGRFTSPARRDDKEEEDDVDYYAYERKTKKHRQCGDRSPGVYDSFP